MLSQPGEHGLRGDAGWVFAVLNLLYDAVALRPWTSGEQCGVNGDAGGRIEPNGGVIVVDDFNTGITVMDQPQDLPL